MQTMTTRTLACAIAFTFLSLMRSDPGALAAGPPGDGEDGQGGHSRSNFRVGHRVMRIEVKRPPAGETRPVDVHLWYPADSWDHFDAPVTEYTSALNGIPLVPALWAPLSWKVASSSAREDPSIFQSTERFPVIIFSHGNTNMPIDYALTFEDLASAGFVVAAPTHVNNSQDDVRMDFANRQAMGVGYPLPFPTCLDGAPWADTTLSRCARANVPQSMADRAQDITATLDALPAALDNRVDLERVGVLGHSRGTVTALTAAGGSTPASKWEVSLEPRVKAIMGMAIGARGITFSADIGSITQPTLLVSGSLDATSPPSIIQEALDALPDNTESAHVMVENAMHRTFDSTYCQQMQSAAAIASRNGRAMLDLHTLERMLIDLAPASGLAMDYCGYKTFTRPVDVTPIVASITGFDVTKMNVPATGLTSDELRPCISVMAITFFEHTLDHPDAPGLPHHFRRDLPFNAGPCRGLTTVIAGGQR